MTVVSYGVVMRSEEAKHVMPLALGLFNAGHYHLRVQTSPQIDLGERVGEEGGAWPEGW